MSQPRAIVTIVNDVGATSMPFNEFVAWRARRYPEERHIVISWLPVDRAGLRGPAMEDLLGRIELLDARGRLPVLARHCRTVFERLRREGIPMVAHLHQPKAAAVYQAIRPLLSWTPPVVFTVHNDFDRYAAHNKVLSAANALLADAVTFVSRSSERAYPGFLRRRHGPLARAIPNGVDLDRVDALRATVTANGAHAARPGGEGLRLINVGRFVEQKNHLFLVELLARLPTTMSLTLVGDGPLRPRVAEAMRARGLEDRVRFTGIIPREDVYRELLRADAFVSPSFWEGLPIAVLEAMALRLPVLLSDIDPHREILEVAPSARILACDPAAWDAALREWNALPAETLEAVGAENRRAVEGHLSLERMHRGYTEVYQDAVRKQGA